MIELKLIRKEIIREYLLKASLYYYKYDISTLWCYLPSTDPWKLAIMLIVIETLSVSGLQLDFQNFQSGAIYHLSSQEHCFT